MTYSSEIWALIKTLGEVMAVAQCKMKRIMLGISLRDQKRNTCILQHTEAEDIVTAIRQNRHIGQDKWQDSRTTGGQSRQQNGVQDLGNDQEDDQKLDGATTPPTTWDQ